MSRRMHPSAGEELAGYQIEALIGRGGMGDVYRAEDPRLRRKVALKLISPVLTEDERFRDRFLTESRLAASLDHPNVIPVYEAGEADGVLYIAMRHVEGTDLRRILDREGPLAPRRALALAGRVADALDAAHAKGLVHRDVKPANILVAAEPKADPPGHVYLSDFGLTKDTTESGMAEAGPFMGTPDYAAPELITRRPVDGRTDLYALGCVLFECLTGEPPFRDESVMATLWGHVNDPVPSASARNPDLPETIDEVLRKALAKEPDQRYSTCRELVEAAREALGASTAELPVPRRRRRALVVAGSAAACLIAVLVAVLLTLGRGGAPPLPSGGELVRIDPATNEAKETIRVGDGPTAVGAEEDAVWVAGYHDGSLWHVDPRTLAATRIPSIGVPYDLAVYGGTVYVAAEGPSVVSGNITAYEASTGHRLGGLDLLACSITAGPEGVWAAGCPNVNRISSAAPLRILVTLPIPFQSPRTAANDRQGLDDMSLGEGAAALADDATPPATTEVKKVSFTITAKQCPDLPQGVTIKVGGTSRKWESASVDATGMTHYYAVTIVTGTARDNRGGRYRFDYHDSFSTTHTTVPYVALLTDHFDLVPKGAFGGGLHTFFVANVTVKSEDPFDAVFEPTYVRGDPIDFRTLKPHCDPI